MRQVSSRRPGLDAAGGAVRLSAAAVVGGLLWIFYGVVEMLAPWGVDAIYDERRGYDVVVARGLFVSYSLPGALALVVTAVVFLGLLRALALEGRAAAAAARVALGLGILALAGVAAGFDPLFTAPRIFGTLALGLAAALAVRRTRTVGSGSWTVLLTVLAVLGIALLPLWPVVHALAWLTPAAGAAVIGAFGVAWLIAGLQLLGLGHRPGGPRTADP